MSRTMRDTSPNFVDLRWTMTSLGVNNGDNGIFPLPLTSGLGIEASLYERDRRFQSFEDADVKRVRN